MNYRGKWGVAYHNQVAVIRALECCHCNVSDGKTVAKALQWIIANHKKYRITTVNLAPVDDKAHAKPVDTEIDAKLATLRQLGIWVSAPTGNHHFTEGISWPSCQPNCFAIGAVRQGKDEVYLDRHTKVDLVVPASATSSSNAIDCGAAIVIREAIDKTGYDWRTACPNVAEAILAIMQRTGVMVEDKATGRSYQRLDLAAALAHVFASKKPMHETADETLRDLEKRIAEIGKRNNPPPAPQFPFDARIAAKHQHDYAQWADLPVEATNALGMKFVLIPPGAFMMGSPKSEPGHGDSPYDETQHPVRLAKPIYLNKYETTVAQFRRFVRAAAYTTDGEKNGGGHAHDERAVWKHRPGTSWLEPGYAGPFKMQPTHPVVHVSFTDAKAFCAWLQESHGNAMRLDLPTEAQWEWACRAGSGTRFWWGDEVDKSGKLLNVGDRSLKETQPLWPREMMPMNDSHAFPAPVGRYAANAFGMHDMLGNVWEFCSTRYGAFPKTLVVDPGDLDRKRGFAVRGGGWSNKPSDTRCATRNADPPHFCHSNLGFRVVVQFP